MKEKIHNLYCKEDCEIYLSSTFIIDSNTLAPKQKPVKFWKGVEYAFIEKEGKFSDRYVNYYYKYIDGEYFLEKMIVESHFYSKEESRKIRIGRILD
jgi:hypothetical protein